MKKAILLGIMIMIVGQAGSAMAATMDINVRANVVGTCKVTTAGPLTVDFLDLTYDAAGSSNATAQTTSFDYWCTNGAAYSYSSAGANDASCATAPAPCMMNAGLTSEIPYSVTLSDTGSGTGSGPSNPDETITVQIGIGAGAADNAEVGLHTDTLTVTLAP